MKHSRYYRIARGEIAKPLRGAQCIVTHIAPRQVVPHTNNLLVSSGSKLANGLLHLFAEKTVYQQEVLFPHRRCFRSEVRKKCWIKNFLTVHANDVLKNRLAVLVSN